MNNYQNLSWDDIKAMYAEIAQLMKANEQKLLKMYVENEQQFKKMYAENEQQFKKMYAEDRQQRKESDERYSKMRIETEVQIRETDKRLAKLNAETDERLAKLNAETDERLNKLGKYLGGIAHSNGDMAEDFFFNTFRRDKTLVNEQFDTIQKNYFYSSTNGYEGPESDIVLFNGKSVAIIEVKYNAKPDNIDIEKLVSNVALFKKYSPAYRNHNIYLGVAAMSFKKGLASKLHNAGIATIHPSGKQIVIYDKALKMF